MPTANRGSPSRSRDCTRAGDVLSGRSGHCSRVCDGPGTSTPSTQPSVVMGSMEGGQGEQRKAWALLIKGTKATFELRTVVPLGYNKMSCTVASL